MEITSNGGADFRQLAAAFKRAGEGGAAIRKATTKVIQGHMARITNEQKDAITEWQPKGIKGHGERRRKQFTEARAKRRAAKTGKAPRARKSHSLRSHIRGAIKSRVAYTGRHLGARIYVDPSSLPPSQRTLPEHVDSKKGWRHPVWGNRKKWVTQHGTPYFSRPIERHAEQVRNDVQAEVDKVMRTLL